MGWVQERSDQVDCSGSRFAGDILHSYFDHSGYWYRGFVVDTVVVRHHSMLLSLLTHPLSGVSTPVKCSKPRFQGSSRGSLFFDASDAVLSSSEF